MARFTRGKSGNPEGRPRGAKNRTTEQLRSLIQTFVETNWQRIQEDFDSMKPVERLNFLNSILRHVLPEPQSFEKLSETQLEQLHEYLKMKYNGKNSNN